MALGWLVCEEWLIRGGNPAEIDVLTARREAFPDVTCDYGDDDKDEDEAYFEGDDDFDDDDDEDATFDEFGDDDDEDEADDWVDDEDDDEDL